MSQRIHFNVQGAEYYRSLEHKYKIILLCASNLYKTGPILLTITCCTLLLCVYIISFVCIYILWFIDRPISQNYNYESTTKIQNLLQNFLLENASIYDVCKILWTSQFNLRCLVLWFISELRFPSWQKYVSFPACICFKKLWSFIL